MSLSTVIERTLTGASAVACGFDAADGRVREPVFQAVRPSIRVSTVRKESHDLVGQMSDPLDGESSPGKAEGVESTTAIWKCV